MRIHTDKLATADLLAAAGKAFVQFERLDVKGSRSHHHAFDVLLSGSSPRRAQRNDFYAATWDEWGIFLAEVFSRDPGARADRYADAESFHRITGDRFRSLTHAQQHRSHRWEWNQGEGSCACGATVNHAA